jgi:hypothetical protein
MRIQYPVLLMCLSFCACSNRSEEQGLKFKGATHEAEAARAKADADVARYKAEAEAARAKADADVARYKAEAETAKSNTTGSRTVMNGVATELADQRSKLQKQLVDLELSLSREQDRMKKVQQDAERAKTDLDKWRAEKQKGKFYVNYPDSLTTVADMIDYCEKQIVKLPTDIRMIEYEIDQIQSQIAHVKKELIDTK